MNDHKTEAFFSIIVPIYNVKEYLEECVNSLEKQNIDNYEVILVDDGSNDGSSEVCDRLKKQHSNIKVFHKTNGGLSDARNFGIKEASGKYILFVDGDDFINENILKDLYIKIKNKNFPQLVFLECKKVYKDKKISMNDGIDAKIESLKGPKLYNYLRDLPKYPASACTKAINRKFLIENNLYFKKGILSEDLEWSARLLLSIEHVAYLENDYYFYRQNRINSISNTSSQKKTLDILNTEKSLNKLIKKQDDQSKKLMLQSIIEYIFRFLIIGYSNIDNKKKYKMEIKEIEHVLGTRKDKVSKIISYTYKIIGIKITNILLNKYLKIRDNH